MWEAQRLLRVPGSAQHCIKVKLLINFLLLDLKSLPDKWWLMHVVGEDACVETVCLVCVIIPCPFDLDKHFGWSAGQRSLSPSQQVKFLFVLLCKAQASVQLILTLTKYSHFIIMHTTYTRTSSGGVNSSFDNIHTDCFCSVSFGFLLLLDFSLQVCSFAVRLHKLYRYGSFLRVLLTFP